MKIGILTSGGDSPGMNAAIRAAARMAIYRKCKPYLIYEGYSGMIRGKDYIKECKWNDVGIISLGGTSIGSARSEEMRTRKGRLCAVENLIRNEIHSLVVIGGDGSLTGAEVLRTEWSSLRKELIETGRIEEEMGRNHEFLSVLGVVGSIDNDMVGTDLTIGADTSLHQIIGAVDSISMSALSHQRAFVVEVMGRNCGWLALMSAIASEADWVFIPEKPSIVGTWEEDMCNTIRRNRILGKRLTIVIVSEGALDSECNPITSFQVNQVINERLELNSKITVLGHVQRGGNPSAMDRLLGSLQSVHAIDLLIKAEAEKGGCSVLIGIQENRMCCLSLKEAVLKTKKVGEALKSKDFARAFELRDPDFRETYIITFTRELNNINTGQSHAMGIINVGAPCGGTNAAVHSFVRHLLSLGHKPIGFYGGFEAVVSSDENIRELTWKSVCGWIGKGGSELGTSRYVPKSKDMDRISQIMKKYEIRGMVLVGGYEALKSLKALSKGAEKYESLRISMIHVPATISNNVPGTEYSIGSDTALNMVVECCDKIRQSASSTKRVFIMEIQGRNCGYLSLFGGIAAGASYSYIPEEGISLSDVVYTCNYLKEQFEDDRNRGKLILINEDVSKTYLPETLANIFTDEAAGLFDSKICKPGHLLQGGEPSPRDRIFGFKFAILATNHILETIQRGGNPSVKVLGVVNGNMRFSSLEALESEMDDEKRRVVNPWWFKYRNIAKILAKHGIPDNVIELEVLVERRESHIEQI